MSDIHPVDELYQLFLESEGVSTDTRTIKPRQIYFALSGENFDGNRFAKQALDKGALAAVVSDPAVADDRCILVRDTLDALQQLARTHRLSLEIPVLGITGSNGKTTTKELIAGVLAAEYRVSFTHGNLNNHIGVPLSILRIPADTDIAIIEMGANHVGEIADLCTMAMPDHGVITNIGMAHIEGFGGREGIKRGKSELYHWLAGHEGLAFVNCDEEFLSDLSSNVSRRVFYGTAQCDDQQLFRYELIKSDVEIELHGNSVATRRIHARSSLFGEYNARNIMTAITIGLHFKVPPEKINEAVLRFQPDNNRSQIIRKEGVTLILDAYNANPTSMQLALENLGGRQGRKVAILGGMNELGAIARDEHAKLVEITRRMALKEVFLVGSHFDHLIGVSAAKHFPDVESLGEYLDINPIEADVVLIKGSRSLRLESAVSHIH